MECYSKEVTGSFDPNDKSVSPAGFGPSGNIDSTQTELTYLIRFQNTGNGPAHFIVVRDTLSPNVDVSSLQMLGTSHNYNLQILDGNVLKWRFDNIMLPDSGSNEPGSHGYIHYKIKRTSVNTPGTQIKNTAYIYFDYNEPVITNTALNTIFIPTGINTNKTTNNNWMVYPNPTNGTLHVANDHPISPGTTVEIINTLGQAIYSDSIKTNFKTIELNNFSNGIYFVKITSDKQSSVTRIILNN